MGTSNICKSAVMSDCQKYRYELRRVWEPGEEFVCFIGLNPSTADAAQDDPTIRRCISFARSWGYGGLIMVNLFAYRLTDSKQLKNVPLPHGRENWNWIESASLEARVVIAAWGGHPMARIQGQRTREFLEACGVELKCIFENEKDKSPAHPLYLKGDLTPSPWPSKP